MDATPGSKKAPPPAAADAVPSAAQQAVEQSSSAESDAAVAAGGKASSGEDDDEQVERFYALLDNIRAMRGMVSTGGSGTAAGRKRARDAEPPWRPAFQMEDFELEEVDSDTMGCTMEEEKKKKRESSAKRPTTDDDEEGEVVVETKGPRRGQPQSHKARRAGVLAFDT